VVIFNMKDNYGRIIDYMRISITDRCNLRCRYCMPQSGVELFPISELLTYEEIASICKEAATLGISKIRITGGEPLVRKDVERLVAMLKGIKGIDRVGLTTNGLLLKDNISKLIDSGLDSVNISLDAADRDAFFKLTGFDLYEKVTEGIDAAYESGIKTKINTVLYNDEFFKGMIDFAKDRYIDVRFIELMPLGPAKEMPSVSYCRVINYIDETYPGWEADTSYHGDGPAKYLNIPGFKGSVGFISPINEKFCDSCNKIRLSSVGQIKPCLCFGNSFDIKKSLREGDIEEVRKILIKSILEKPMAHCFDDIIKMTEVKKMASIGG